jgi:precorrin-6B methylase 1
LTHAAHAKLVVRTAKAHVGGLVVRLMDGDPSTFNGLAEEALACAKAGIPIEIVPGVSAVTAVPSYAGVPLTTATSPAYHVSPRRVGTSRQRSTGRDRGGHRHAESVGEGLDALVAVTRALPVPSRRDTVRQRHGDHAGCGARR